MKYTVSTKPGIKTLLIAIAAILALLLAACTVDNTDTGNAIPGGLGAFVGQVNDDLFIAIASADHPSEEYERVFLVYLCDGADQATWLRTESRIQPAVAEGDDVRVEFAVVEGGVSGHIEIAGGEPQPFTATRAEGDAGLYRAEETFNETAYIGGWIVLTTFAQRGAVTVDGVVVANPTLDVDSGQAATEVGTFSNVNSLPCIPVPRFGCIPVPN